MLSYPTPQPKDGGIAIIGIGGAGANVLKCFAASSAENISLYTLSLDERVGRACGNVQFIQLGEGISHGLGSGGDPEVGRLAMEETTERVQEVLRECKLLVMVVGLGGGTGSGAAPVLAHLAHEIGVFLVSVVMLPFSFEGKRRQEQAAVAHEEIARLSDIVFCFENDYMEELFRDRTGARAVFEEVDRLLAKATASVPMMAGSPGLINLGLDELAVALQNSDSRCIFGSGSGYGTRRATQAARAVIDSPLATYHGALRFARTVIVHIAGGESLSITEIRQAMQIIREALRDEDVQLFFGVAVKPNLGEEMRITLIASIDAEEFRNARVQTDTPVRPTNTAAEDTATPTPALPDEEQAAPAEPPPAAVPAKPQQPDEAQPGDTPTGDTEEVFYADTAEAPAIPEVPESIDRETAIEPEQNPTDAPEEETGPAPAVVAAQEPEHPLQPVRSVPLPLPPQVETAPHNGAIGAPRHQMQLFGEPTRQEPFPPGGSNYRSVADTRVDPASDHFVSSASGYKPYTPLRRNVPAPHYRRDDLDTPPSMRIRETDETK